MSDEPWDGGSKANVWDGLIHAIKAWKDPYNVADLDDVYDNLGQFDAILALHAAYQDLQKNAAQCQKVLYDKVHECNRLKDELERERMEVP